MNYRTAIFPTLACTFALAAGSAGAGVVSDAATAAGMERLSSDEIGELRELLVARGIPPARHLAGEITREITESNSQTAIAALFRPPVLHSPEARPAAAGEAGKPAAAGPVRASEPPESVSPLGNLLRKVLRFLNFRS